MYHSLKIFLYMNLLKLTFPFNQFEDKSSMFVVMQISILFMSQKVAVILEFWTATVISGMWTFLFDIATLFIELTHLYAIICCWLNGPVSFFFFGVTLFYLILLVDSGTGMVEGDFAVLFASTTLLFSRNWHITHVYLL